MYYYLLFIFHQYDFQTYVSDRSQCFKSHAMFDFEFAYKLQLHYYIHRLVFIIWMVEIIKMKIPLGSWKLYLYAKKTYHENQQNEIFALQNKRCAKYTLEKRTHPTVPVYHTLLPYNIHNMHTPYSVIMP